jgi:NADPH-dependent 2,4-dienoyl-CoA reductase/sulfur reductase-like enzyme
VQHDAGREKSRRFYDYKYIFGQLSERCSGSHRIHVLHKKELKMVHYQYLIVGGGMTASAAVSGIREVDENGSIGLITAEETSPYDRPPLSKQLWTGRKQLAEIYHALPESVDVYHGRTVQTLDAVQKHVFDNRGHRFTYDKLLLATGSSPRRLPFGSDQIIYFRTANDYERLRKLTDLYEHFTVIGGGFIGSEIAAALRMQGKQVAMIFPEDGIGGRVFPADLSQYLVEYYREKGIEVLAGTAVSDLAGSGSNLSAELDNGRSLKTQAVIAGIGVIPSTMLAEQAGLAVDNGIIVNEQLQTSHPDIYAAGDVANYPDALLGTSRRVEHEDAANSMGKTAGRIMAGDNSHYDHSPMFYSDLFDLGYEAVGELDAGLETVSDWQEPFRKGVVYYLRDGRVRGILLWNVWDKVDAARQLIASGPEISQANFKNLL